MSVSLKSNLPEQIVVSDPLIAIAIVDILTANGYTRSVNANTFILERAIAENGVIRISLTKSKKVQYQGWGSRNLYPHPKTLAEVKDLLLDTPIFIGQYTAEIGHNGVQVGCTFVSWETIEKLLAKRPAPKHEVHNPDGVVEYGADEGYRLLTADEIDEEFRPLLGELEVYGGGDWWIRGQCGSDRASTYRTKLSRAELRSKRDLPPESV